MSVEVVPGGHRRIDRVLDPGFTEEIADGAGSRFDPAVVDALTAIVPDLPTATPPLHERSLHDRSLHDGPPHDAGSVDSLARAIP
jgi:hypothetical protein